MQGEQEPQTAMFKMADASSNEKSDARPKRSRMLPLENENGSAVKPLKTC